VRQRALPARERDVLQQVRRRHLEHFGFFRRHGERRGRIVQRRLQVEAGMAASQLVAGQRRGQQQQRVGVAGLARQEGREGVVEVAQPAGGDPARELVQHVLHAATSCPLNRRSSASIKALGGFSRCRPPEGAACPRRNR
jgi:hypothetical protein